MQIVGFPMRWLKCNFVPLETVRPVSGHPFGKIPANVPGSLLHFHCTSIFANSIQTPGSTEYSCTGQIEGKSLLISMTIPVFLWDWEVAGGGGGGL